MKQLIQRMFIVLCLFAVCAIAVTYASIQHAKEEKKVASTQDVTPTGPIEVGIDLYGTYDQNDLLIQSVTETRQNAEIQIPQIEGLKDLEVQGKVNQDIYSRVQELLKEYPAVGYGEYYVRANFANVISISYHVGDGNKYEQLPLNYNLVTGERLMLEDLFLKDADITQCVRSAFYNMLTLYNQYDVEGNYQEVVSPDENQLYKYVKGYLSSEEQSFVFSPSEIYFNYDSDYSATLRMVDVADQIAIYSRYMTEESLFTRDDIGYKNIFTCADGQYSAFKKIEYGYLEPNFWYDITIWNTYLENDFTGEKLERYLALEEEFYASMEQKVEEYRIIAKNNPDKFYMLFLKPTAHVYYWSGGYSDVAELNESVELYEMPMEVYETTYRDKLIDTYRYVYFAMRGGAYLEWSEDDGATRQTFDENKIYNYITGEELTRLEDVFHEDSGYEDIIRSRTRETLAWGTEYSWSEISALVDTLQYRLDGASVYVTIPSMEDFYFRVFFGEFENSMLKIFD